MNFREIGSCDLNLDEMEDNGWIEGSKTQNLEPQDKCMLRSPDFQMSYLFPLRFL